MAAAAGDATAAPPTPRRGASKEARATKFTLLLLAFEVLVILCYAFTADYDCALRWRGARVAAAAARGARGARRAHAVHAALRGGSSALPADGACARACAAL